MESLASQVWEAAGPLILRFARPRFSQEQDVVHLLAHGREGAARRRQVMVWLTVCDTVYQDVLGYLQYGLTLHYFPGEMQGLTSRAFPTTVRGRHLMHLLCHAGQHLPPVTFPAVALSWGEAFDVFRRREQQRQQGFHLSLVRPDGSHRIECTTRARYTLQLNLHRGTHENWVLQLSHPEVRGSTRRRLDMGYAA